jgi:UDP-N-acetylmuramoyl-L-alanyl-D-glutamate--2,6-diaminopimelate ligase
VAVPGRSELVNNSSDYPIMIDYAHTPESLSCILQAVKTYTKGKVICVFGCGGDRDHEKRPIMGEIAGKIADYTIVTTDNPRTEVPEDIIAEIEKGISKTKGKYEVVVDRREAIKKAISMMNKKDMVILAGKGHEKYQEVGKEKLPFDEKEIVKEILAEIKNK